MPSIIVIAIHILVAPLVIVSLVHLVKLMYLIVQITSKKDSVI